MKEVYWNRGHNMLVIEDLVTGDVCRLDELPSSFLQQFDASIAILRPVAYQALCIEYGAGPHRAFDRVFQFAACNFSTKDDAVDIDDDFNFVTEIVACPVRHKCDLPYCRFETELSQRELEIVRLFGQGLAEISIADRLFISPATVHNHVTNIYRKLGLQGSQHPDRLLVTWAVKNKIH